MRLKGINIRKKIRTMFACCFLSAESSDLCRDNLWPGSHWYKRWYNFFARPIAVTHDRNRRHDEDFESC